MTDLTATKRKKFSLRVGAAVSLIAAAAAITLLFAAPAAAAPDLVASADISWYSVSDDKFEISKDVQLAGLAKLVNEGTNFEGKTIILSADIDLSSAADWKPIGTSAKPFKGTFNGSNKTVKNMTIKSASGSEPAGLFGVISAGGKVQNLKLTNVKILAGARDTGGIAGTNNGAVTSCTVTGAISGSGGFNTGGIAGTNGSGSTIEKCTVASCGISGANGKTGALAGQNNGTVKSNTVQTDVKINNAPVSAKNLVGGGNAAQGTMFKGARSGKDSGGCDAGFGFAGLAALTGAGLILRRRERG
jgi:hypothetical protein